MEQKKFLRYCPVCNNYNEDTGICTYLHENILQYPEKFVKLCDGKYLSLIKGKEILPADESSEEETDVDEMVLVSVFATKNNALFQVAKTILEDNRIEFYPVGDYVNTLNPAVYDTEIKVLEKDADTARKLLSELTPDLYQPESEMEKKMLSPWNIIILILFLVIIVVILSFLK